MSQARNIIWVIDTSSICEVRRSIPNSQKPDVFKKLTEFVRQGRIVFVKQVVEELERAAESKDPDAQLEWARQNHADATSTVPSFDEVKEVLAVVPAVLDAEKDSGVEEADPYLLALAVKLRKEGKDARIITEEKKDYAYRMSISTAGGLLGVPSVPLKAFLNFEEVI